MRAVRPAVGGVLIALVVGMGAAVSPSVGDVATTRTSADQASVARAVALQDGRKKPKQVAKAQKAVFTPPAGVLLSNPLAANRREILTRVIRTIQATRKGEEIRIAVWNFDDRPTALALNAADRRGVNVRVVVAGSVANPNWNLLTRQLNKRKGDNSYARKCKGSCRSKGKIMHSKVFLFNEVGKASHVSMFGSANLTTPAGNRQWNDMITSKGPDLYRFFLKMFNQYAADKPASPVYVRQDIGKYRGYLFPVGDRKPVVNELRHVQCTGAKQMPGGRTKIRIAIAGWFDSYGTAIAQQIRKLWGQGCDIKIVTTLAGRGVNQTLRDGGRRGPVPIRQIQVDNNNDGVPERYLHMKAISIRGVFDGDRTANVVFTGSPNWSSRAARSDEVWVRVEETQKIAIRYMQHIDGLFNSPYSYARTMAPNGRVVAGQKSLADVPGGGFGRTSELPSWFEND